MKEFLRLTKSHADRLYNLINGRLNKHQGVILLLILLVLLLG